MIVEVSYHGPTNSRGSRLVAKDNSGKRVSVPWDHGLSDEQNYDRAAAALWSLLGRVGEGKKLYSRTLKGGKRIYLATPEILDVDALASRSEVQAVIRKLRGRFRR